ncbi:hypothetical protein EOB77_33725 [Mesorhizobium sp. M7A.F.Ca.MR.228.00.0.0]|nr:hypothetical protein EOB80_14700 [Mesorhizobium sp. M7A.F.Ca.MR.245.00.0.0]RUV42799.1 hypothetical protein EOB77_33725 [Mesorhizobium sp. M7A.F.Ca.MR.228.00.0.0]
MSNKIEARFATGARGEQQLCAVPGCNRKSSLAGGTGLSPFHCRYHVLHKARHGSHWCATYRAAELGPYVVAASAWLAQRAQLGAVGAAIQELASVLAGAGRVDPAMNLRGQPASYRARVAFARLREAGIEPRRLLAIYLSVCALIEDDLGSHRTQEFKIVQAAKAVHRLASGTHRGWEMFNPLGPDVHTELHAYPRSSGIVLRKVGEKLEMAGEPLAREAVGEIIAIKTKRFGEHPSHLPGWRPSWEKRRA